MNIPLFPLPMVFFPRVLTPLHIFEPRYRLMINECIDQSASFGIVMIPPGSVESESTIRTVGVTAQIIQHERLEDGRLNIVVAGKRRFRVERFSGSAPYWRADVEFFDDDPENESELREACGEVAWRYRDLRRRVARLHGVEADDPEIAEDPVTLSFVVSSILNLDLESRQGLLEITSTWRRLRALVIHLEEAIQRVNAQLGSTRGNGKHGNGHFSVN
ncbi:MAG TPA: LON peptidase substrate-binding domain-containing protein [Terriglobia bacterium]|nr:LON peptidase substrate-binding domain-containing protein [Terriglobia bacterium]